jgi:hypothetical protein
MAANIGQKIDTANLKVCWTQKTFILKVFLDLFGFENVCSSLWREAIDQGC